VCGRTPRGGRVGREGREQPVRERSGIIAPKRVVARTRQICMCERRHEGAAHVTWHINTWRAPLTPFTPFFRGVLFGQQPTLVALLLTPLTALRLALNRHRSLRFAWALNRHVEKPSMRGKRHKTRSVSSHTLGLVVGGLGTELSSADRLGSNLDCTALVVMARDMKRTRSWGWWVG